MTGALTLGGMSPASGLSLIPSKKQMWWKPCLRRGENGDTHVWYLSSTSDGSLLCHECRIGAPRVVVGPKAWIADIREAIELDDLQRIGELLRAGPDVVERAAEPPPPFKPRDRVDWMEFFSERAAMFEFLGGHDRAAAEALARELAGAAP